MLVYLFSILSLHVCWFGHYRKSVGRIEKSIIIDPVPSSNKTKFSRSDFRTVLQSLVARYTLKTHPRRAYNWVFFTPHEETGRNVDAVRVSAADPQTSRSLRSKHAWWPSSKFCAAVRLVDWAEGGGWQDGGKGVGGRAERRRYGLALNFNYLNALSTPSPLPPRALGSRGPSALVPSANFRPLPGRRCLHCSRERSNPALIPSFISFEFARWESFVKTAEGRVEWVTKKKKNDEKK